MDKYEILGFLLQDLRDDREPDEEDIGPAILRETTKIFECMVRHGHLTRDMFDTTGLGVREGTHGLPKRYSFYQTTNYPISFVTFADDFASWLLGEDNRKRLELLDLIEMIKQYSGRNIEIVRHKRTASISVRTDEQGDAELVGEVRVE